jgi:hypothetical protein
LPVARPPARALNALDEVDGILKLLPVGSIAFNAPATLGLGDRTTISLLLSAREPLRDLVRRVTEVGDRVGARIRIADRMEAHLSGLGFKVQAVTPELQAVSGEDVTEWKWDIEATETGRQRLHLTLTAIIDVHGSQSPRTVRTFDKVLEIRVSLSRRLSNFVEGNWQWLWTAILIPLSALALRSRARRTSDAGRR